MSTSAEQRLLRMVDDALDLPEAERAAFLEREAGGDPDLLARAHRMLIGVGSTGPDLGDAIGSAVGAAAASALADHGRYPDRIGPYAILGVLGEGGMGVVLRARQDEPVSREVAVKLIRAGTHAPGIIARFRAERQTLASLTHPNIAKLHDAGTTADGLPYFAMELIGGEPITSYCDRKRLGVDERIALFRTLLDAVQHAHQRAIVHRDLKPSNVLVTEVDGRPLLKVIDFGIARATGPERGVTRLTAVGGGVGTLEYMSPEQLLQAAHGGDTRSDIYSLGVLLYELLTGRLPHEAERLRSAPPSELERILLHTPVPRASRRITEDTRTDPERARVRSSDARTLKSRLSGDLDAIIEVAMAPDPDRRYPTVAGLDEDLERFQSGRPITARPHTARYRLRKFASRNRYAVAASTLAAAVVVTMGVVFTVRLARERDRAAFEAEKAVQVASFLESLFEAPDPTAPDAADLTARELLDAGTSRLREELADQPELRSALLGAIGRTYSGLGLWGEAEELLAGALEDATRMSGIERAEILFALGRVRNALGKADAAEAPLEEALALRTDLLGAGDPQTAAVLIELSYVHRIRGDYPAAERLARQAVSIDRQSSDSLALAQALHALAFAQRLQGRLAEAEQGYREALAMRTALLDPGHPLVLETMSNLSLSLEAAGRYEEAEQMSRQVLDGRRARLGDDHPQTLQALNNLAFVLWRRGHYARAGELFAEAVELGERIHPEDNATKAIGLNNLAAADYRTGAFAEAADVARRALAMDQRLYGRLHPRIAGDMLTLGRALVALGQLEEADSLHTAAVALQEELFGPDHPDRADGLGALAATRVERGRAVEAVALLTDALRIRESSLGTDNPRTAQTLHDLGLALLAAEDWSAAEQRLRQALDIRRRLLRPEHPDIAATLVGLGRLLRRTDRIAESRAALDEASQILGDSVDPSDPSWREVQAELAALDGVATAR
ncbi:MAG: tetratricopeptide repeat protein [Gemmatimonadales bacterium]